MEILGRIIGQLIVLALIGFIPFLVVCAVLTMGNWRDRQLARFLFRPRYAVALVSRRLRSRRPVVVVR